MPHRRILHVPRRFVEHEWGGTESVLANLLAAQKAAGWEPEIHTSLALSTTRRETWRGIEVRRYPYVYPFFGLTAAQKAAMDKKGGNLLSFSLLWGLVRRPGVRLIHAHVLKRPGAIARTAARLRGVPCVVTLHGGQFDVPAGELSSLTEPQRGKLEWGKIPGAVLGSRRVLEDAAAVICVGRAEAEKARAQLGHDRIYHVANGVDFDFFANGNPSDFLSSQGLSADARIVLCVSRFDPQKDQLAVIDAFDKAAAGEPRARLILAGPATSPEYLGKVVERARQSPLRDRIRVLGPLAPGSPELAGAFRAAEIFMIASRHEPFGIVVLEAWSAGCCVVASTAGGLADLVREGRTGFSFPPGDAEAAAAALRRALANREAAAATARAGRELAQTEYTWERIAAKTETIYQAAEDWWHGRRKFRRG